jgi:hypothetical protein
MRLYGRFGHQQWTRKSRTVDAMEIFTSVALTQPFHRTRLLAQ